jgi:hypothetical protein
MSEALAVLTLEVAVGLVLIQLMRAVKADQELLS